MLSFLLRRPTLTPGSMVNRDQSSFAPARWDGVVVADLGEQVLVEWPKSGLTRERRRLLTAVDIAEPVAPKANPRMQVSRILRMSGATG